MLKGYTLDHRYNIMTTFLQKYNIEYSIVHQSIYYLLIRETIQHLEKKGLPLCEVIIAGPCQQKSQSQNKENVEVVCSNSDHTFKN